MRFKELSVEGGVALFRRRHCQNAFAPMCVALFGTSDSTVSYGSAHSVL